MKFWQICALGFACVPLIGCGPQGSDRHQSATVAQTSSKSEAPLPANVSANASDEGSAWSIDRNVSNLDNVKTVVAYLESTNTVANSIGTQTNGRLIVRCQNRKFEIFIVWPAFMGTQGSKARWKFDQGELHSHFWSDSQDGTGTFVTSPKDFAKQLGSSRSLIVGAEPYEKTETELDFKTTGADKAVGEALDACSSK